MSDSGILLTIEKDGIKYAEIIRADARVEHTRFFSPAESSFQFGLLAHPAGFVEAAHYHKPFKRSIEDLQQFFVVQRGKIELSFFTNDGELITKEILKPGDGVVLIHGVHGLKVLEDMQCLSVKQGPFLGTENDKIFVKANE